MNGLTKHAARTVCVGDVEIGGANTVRIQSMTNTDTRDVAATARQIERLVDAGCEIVRVTTPSVRDAEALGELGKTLAARRVRVPIVADVHFTPDAALRALEFADKVRVNPGNFADRKRFEQRSYSDDEYDAELIRVADRFRPVVARAKALGRALRIGTNQGSLSDRIVNRFGDSPEGMVQSALEFLDVCDDESFHDVVISMKSSNPVLMIDAYRKLADALADRPGSLARPPFHLGVTEAGRGLDGRIKSAIGIGSLLREGIGETIRVSLTEDPVAEIPVARALASMWRGPSAWADVAPTHEGSGVARLPRRTRPSRVELDLAAPPDRADDATAERLSHALRFARDRICEGLIVDGRNPADAGRLADWLSAIGRHEPTIPIGVRIRLADAGGPLGLSDQATRVLMDVAATTPVQHLRDAAARCAGMHRAIEWCLEGDVCEMAGLTEAVLDATRDRGIAEIVLSVSGQDLGEAAREVARAGADHEVPFLLALRPQISDMANVMLRVSAELGVVLCDGLGDSVSLPVATPLPPDGPESPIQLVRSLEVKPALDLAYRILQGTRVRTTRAEFISCPSCGRTQFDLEEVTERIERRTAHLPDVKIAIMGCIVNGPGEMADADFGYVGAGPGEISLYVGREVVERRIPAAEAEDRLVELIRNHDRWIEPPAAGD